MSKKATKKMFVPVRRAVKRGAPPIIKPRRMVARGLMKVRTSAGRPGADPLTKLASPTAVAPPTVTHSPTPPPAATSTPTHTHDDEAMEAIAMSEAAGLGEAGPEEIAEFEKNALADAAVIAPGGDEAPGSDESDDEEEEAQPAQKAPTTAEPSNFLAMYFKEMAELDVLRPDEEFRQAKDIETLEVELWDRILGFAAMTDHILKVIERTLENSLTEFRPLRRSLKAGVSQERLGKAAHKVSERLRAIDIDKRLIEAALQELRKIHRGEPGRVIGDKLPFSPKSPQFRTYLQSVSRAMARAQHAKNEFVKANLRLVVSIARRFNHGRMPLADLIQEGNIGLIKAVERFDYRRGYRFSTYASWWIRHAISRALADKGRAVRLPVHMIDAYHRVAKSKRELTSKLGRQPTVEELGVATGIAAPKIEKMRSYLLDQSFSLDRPVSDEDGRRFIDFIQDPNAENISPIDTLADAAMTSEVRELLTSLKPIEADILRQRFGLDDDKELTLKEIGEKYNLSRERIRQLQEQALMKMRRALQRKDLM
jgi:RNA polymerase sigma factor (sigma-70 family)